MHKYILLILVYMEYIILMCMEQGSVIMTRLVEIFEFRLFYTNTLALNPQCMVTCITQHFCSWDKCLNRFSISISKWTVYEKLHVKGWNWLPFLDTPDNSVECACLSHWLWLLGGHQQGRPRYHWSTNLALETCYIWVNSLLKHFRKAEMLLGNLAVWSMLKTQH